MTTEGSSFFSAEWLEGKNKRKPENDKPDNPKPPKTPKPEAKPKPTPKGKVIAESDDDSKSE